MKTAYNTDSSHLFLISGEHPPAEEKNFNAYFGAYSHSVGCQHRNLYKLSVMMDRMTYFILQAHTGTCVSHN